MLVRTRNRGRRSSTLIAGTAERDQIGRLTIYTSPETEFAVRYLALLRRQSVSKLLAEQVDALLKKEGIDPKNLPGVTSKSKT